MIRLLFSSTLFLLSLVACAQEPTVRPHCANEKFDKKVSNIIRFSVPVIGVEELKSMQDEVLILDARKKEEYEISHIEGAKHFGFRQLEMNVLEDVPKDQPIVLYCSIGYRSEKVGEKLQKMGFTNVHNLYGSIFEWINQGETVLDKDEKPTTKVHTYNKKWSKWVEDGKADKVW